MLLQSFCHKERLNFLVEKYIDILSSNIGGEEVLVLLLNSYQKTLFLERVKNKKPDIDVSQVYTLYGLCYNSFMHNSGYIQELIKCDKSEILNLCGLEVSQYIFKQSLSQADFSDYISKVNLLHQLFRRYSLIVQNCLSLSEVKKRSEMLNETFYREAQEVIENYKKKTIEYRSFDYLRQLAILPLIYKNTNYFSKINYLLVNDADEYSYAFWAFINEISKQIKASYITYDKLGSSRCGYLCAYKNGIDDYKKLYHPEEILVYKDKKFKKEAEEFYRNIKNGTKFELNTIKISSSVKRLDMFDEVLKKIKELINKGVKPCEISVVTPVINDILYGAFEYAGCGIDFQILSGGEKLSDNPLASCILAILKPANNIEISTKELKKLLINLFKIPYKKCLPVLKQYETSKKLCDFSFDNNLYSEKYQKFKSLIAALKAGKNTLSEQIKIIFENLIRLNIEDYDKKKYEFLIKEAQSFETAFSQNTKNIVHEFIIQTENSIISENPANSFEKKPNSVTVSTPQKIIDYSLETKFQFWLDISSDEWLKQDTGTLYNSWVFSRDWDNTEYTFEKSIEYTRDKTARIVRKLCLLAEKEIYLFQSLYDDRGCGNFGGLNNFLQIKSNENRSFRIVPRLDQKPVLEYGQGKLGITAVPGAGKTTILLLLVIKLINEKIPPENIFVLTYMEAAAKNFKERIQNMFPQGAVLPNISTIHGLALRIIKENGNYNKIGLDENFEICDDNTKEKIARELFFKLKIDEEKADNYLKCISAVKLSHTPNLFVSEFKEIKDFFVFFNEYNGILKSNNLLDYDDMLCYALKILEDNSDISEYYQNLCRYVIEDEAQDSTEIQQKLIELLSKKYQNYVRCGDINQAITSTFTSSSIDGFRDFIKNNKKIEMNSSQRCAKPVYELANLLVKCKNETGAFYPVEIKKTDNNPKVQKKPEYKLFLNEKDEKKYIAEEIKNILNQDSEASIAILLRLNYQVNEYGEFLSGQKIKTETITDCLSQRKIYKIIHAVLNVVNNPKSNLNILNLAKCCNDMGINRFTEEDFKLLSSEAAPFIDLNFDDIGSGSLQQLYFDIDYWLNGCPNDISALALKTGLYYAQNTGGKSNAYIISAFIKRLETSIKREDELINQIERIADKPISSLKFFEEEFNGDKETSVKIMTVHKSKGDEFDYVFIPEFNEENYPFDIEHVKLKNGSHFIQTIKNLAENKPSKTREDLKIEQLNETLRLIYVGITRAKKGIYFSCAKNYKKRKNSKSISFFEDMLADRLNMTRK